MAEDSMSMGEYEEAYGWKPPEPDVTECFKRGYHDYQPFIDPKSGAFVKCKDCGRRADCEDPDSDLEGV